MQVKEIPSMSQPINQQRNREEQNLFYAGVLAAFIIGAISLVILTVNGQTQKNIIWDLKGLEKDLTTYVYGQDEAVGKITRVLRSVVDTEENSRVTLVMLLGGPGVGKHFILNIIERHVKCKYNQHTPEDNCKLNFNNFKWSNVSVNLSTRMLTNDEYNGSRIMTADFSSLDLVLHSSNIQILLDQINTDISNTNITFITGNIMSEWTVKNLINSIHYEYYLFYEASKLEKLMSDKFPNYNIHIVIFKPLEVKDVKKCFNDQKIKLKIENYGKDFVPLGCKTQLGTTTCVHC